MFSYQKDLEKYQQHIRSGEKNANARTQLTENQKALLNELGMNWTSRHNTTWDKAYRAACQYKKVHRNLDIPVAYTTADGVALGRWIRRQKTAKLTAERKAKLAKIGMTWEKDDPWTEKFLLVKAYYDQHGNTKMPADLVVNGVWLRRWLSEQISRLNERPTGRNKTVKRLALEQIAKLRSVGITPSASAYDERTYYKSQAEEHRGTM